MESAGGRSDPHPLTGKEEAIKRNTDCVYFLASPLTCKKGTECEYRHSEGARVNPRDCKFWFSGNCLNPKCLFRHPPLDGLVGNPLTTPGPTMAASQTATSTHLPSSSAYNLNRNNVPCYYFQMGSCLKGDKCPFMHFPQSVANPVAKQIVKASPPVSTQLEASKKEAWKVKGCILNQQNSAPSPPVKPPQPPSAVKVNAAFQNSINHSAAHKNLPPPFPARNGLPLSQSTGVLLSTGAGFSQPRSLLLHAQPEKHHVNDMEAGEIFEEPSGTFHSEQKRRPSRHQNDKLAEEGFRESSPGFDVLVDDAENDAEYLHEKDGFRSKSIHGGRNLNHDSGSWSDRDQDRHRISSISDRILDKPVLPARRSAAYRHGSPEGIEETDLRHRLTKYRRLNGSLSTTVPGREPEPYIRHESEMLERYSDRDRRPENTSISSRLRGRITLPKASSPEFSSDFHSGDGRGRRRNRVSPMRPSGLLGRLGERLTRKPVEDSPVNPRILGAQQMNFDGPRSLAELKGGSNNIRPMSPPKHNGSKSVRAAELPDTFDGPKPLSALRKRSRETSRDDDRKPLTETEAGSLASKADSVPREPSFKSVVVVEGEAHIPSEIEQMAFLAEVRDASAEEEEVDFADRREREYDYETVDGGGYKTEDDDENTDPMNIDLDDEEDEDDFAKKIGLIFS